MDDVYIVELVGTGLKGFPKNRVVQIAVCRMFADGSDFDTVFDETIAVDPRDLDKESLDFLEDNHSITAEQLYLGAPEDLVISKFQEQFFDKEFTSFDVNFTFGRYLAFEPWDTTGEVYLLNSISNRLSPEILEPVEGKSPIHGCYDKLCPDNPLGLESFRSAKELAQMSTEIMMVLRRNGMF